MGCHKAFSDGLPYEKRADGKGEPVCIAEEVPFELPEGWAWARVKSVTAIGTGATPLKANDAYYKGGTIPWITSGSASLPVIDKPDGYITELAVKETNCTVYPAGSLVIAMYGEGQTRGRISQLAIEAATNQACAVLQYIKDGCLQRYIRICYEQNYQGLRDQAKGGNQPNLNQTIIGNFLLPVPPLAEQRRIVAALDRCLSLVDTVERDGEELGALFGRLRSKVLDLAIRGELTERDPSDEPAGELLARIRDEKLEMVKRGELKPKDVKGDTVIFTGSDGLRYEKRADGRGEPVCIEDEIPFEIPETWAWARLGSLGRIVGGGTPKTSEPEYWAAAKMGIPWITPADMSTNCGLMIDGGSRDITKAGLEKSSAQLLRSGAVVMSSRAPIGYIGIATHPLCTNQGCKSVDLALPELGVWIVMCLRGLMADILRRASGTTFQEISGSEFSKTLVPIAPLNEQKRARLLFLELRNSLTNL